VSVSLWLQAFPHDHTQREAASIERALRLLPGAELLDVPCGGGRLSLAFAARGYRVTGVDLSSEFLEHARSCDGGDEVTWERRDIRDLPWRDHFDAAFCVGNSFGYLDDEGNATFLGAVRSALKPNARFFLQTPMVLENLVGHLQDRSWWKIGDTYLLVTNEYDARRSRLAIEYTFVSDGRIDVRRASHRVRLSRACGADRERRLCRRAQRAVDASRGNRIADCDQGRSSARLRVGRRPS
jgi:SAM-dependent methyltransferase